MEFLTFRPAKEKKKGFYAEVPINLVFNGPFHNIAAFIDKIVHYPRIIKITSLIRIFSLYETESEVVAARLGRVI